MICSNTLPARSKIPAEQGAFHDARVPPGDFAGLIGMSNFDRTTVRVVILQAGYHDSFHQGIQRGYEDGHYGR